MSKKIDLVGRAFGRLKVIEGAGRNKHQQTLWKCICECGNERVLTYGKLAYGHTSSCGCLLRDKGRVQFTTHGLSKTDEFKIWCGIKSRVYNPNVDSYSRYGGRGIAMCQRWLDSFENFLEDMGKRPSKRHSIDRFPDEDGDYGPENCRWALPKPQAERRSTSRWFEYKGERKVLSDWLKQFGVTYVGVSANLAKGISFEETIERLVNKVKGGLSKAQVMEIFNSTKLYRELSAEYNISISIITSIKVGKQYSFWTGKQYVRQKTSKNNKKIE